MRSRVLTIKRELPFSSQVTSFAEVVVDTPPALIASHCTVWNPWALIALCYSQNNIIIMDRTSTTLTSSGHTWTTENSNLTNETEHTTLSQNTFIKCFQDPIFTKPIHKETSERLVQAILDCHPSIYQNNLSPSQDNTDNTQLFQLNETPLNNLPSHNLDPEPLPQIQNQNMTSNPLSDNRKHNSKPSNNTSTLKCLNQQTPPLQINKYLPWLPSTQQEFLDTKPLDWQQRTLVTRSITSSENPQRIHPISRQQLLYQQSKSIDPNMLNPTNLTET